MDRVRVGDVNIRCCSVGRIANDAFCEAETVVRTFSAIDHPHTTDIRVEHATNFRGEPAQKRWQSCLALREKREHVRDVR
jgi:hypothetical protein